METMTIYTIVYFVSAVLVAPGLMYAQLSQFDRLTVGDLIIITICSLMPGANTAIIIVVLIMTLANSKRIRKFFDKTLYEGTGL